MSKVPHRSMREFCTSMVVNANLRQRLCFSHGWGPLSPMRYVSSFLGLRRLRQYLRKLVNSPAAKVDGSI